MILPFSGMLGWQMYEVLSMGDVGFYVFVGGLMIGGGYSCKAPKKTMWVEGEE